MINFPDNLSKQQFLNQVWQQKPLLFKNALDNASSLISKQQLFDLSLSENIESRLLMEKGAEDPWQLFHGPQDIQQLEAITQQSHWTLLVQSVNLWHQGCAKLLEDFNFIPQWRLDDIMISYATESGSVGPHTDHYDVFLIQLSGTRRWIVGEPNAKTELVDPDSGSQHIKPYPERMNEVLHAGDMLYIPPDTAHHGISIEPGMTLSVGFRSPALSEMLMLFAEQLMISKKESYYVDPLFTANASSTEISPSAMSKAVNWISSLEDYDQIKRKAFGRLQTQPKQELLLSPVEEPILELINSGVVLKRDPAARVAWYQASEEVIWLFINGDYFERPSDEKDYIDSLSQSSELSLKSLSSHLANNKSNNLLQIVVESGLFGID